jgi:hypothetical protein
VESKYLGKRQSAEPQTPIDPAKLMVWVGQTKGASFSPIGTVRLPLFGKADGPILHAQRVLAAWAVLSEGADWIGQLRL